MTVQVSSNQSLNLLSFVGSDQVPGQNIIFCNGILNNAKNATISAKMLSRELNNRKVFLFYNPSNLNHFIDYQGRLDREFELSSSLANLILQLIRTSKKQGIRRENNCVTLFAHSHGATLVNWALFYLSELDQTAKQHVNVYTFGGATLIQNSFANKVHNYLFDNDVISEFGNAISCPKSPFNEIKRIQDNIKKGFELQTAIKIEAIKYSMQFQSHTEEYIEQKLFLKDPKYLKKITELQNYSVTFLEGFSYDCPGTERLVGKGFFGFFKALGKNIFFYITKNHEFSSYMPQIQKIASQVNAKESPQKPPLKRNHSTTHSGPSSKRARLSLTKEAI